MSDYFRILTRLVDTPLFLDAEKATIISEQVSLRLAKGMRLDSGLYTPTIKTLPEHSKDIFLVKVFDSLVSKNGAGDSGFTSYEDIASQIDLAVSQKVKALGFYIDSPGGEAIGMEGIVNKIREIPKKHGIRTFAFTDGYAASAAYGIASATQTIYAMPTSRLGSIAAIRTLIDMTKADAEEGLKYVLLRSKEDKALYNPHEEISPKVLEKAKSDLALLDSAFNSLVMKNRGNLSLEAIIGFQGNTYFGSEAVQLGLADALVETFDEVMAIERRLINRGMNVMTEEEIQALQAQNASLLAQVAASSTEAKALFSAERERISKLTLAAETLKIPKDRLVKAIDSGISYEDGLSAFETFAEISGSKNAINTMGGNSSLDIPPVEDTSASSSPFAALARGMDKAIELGLLRGGN